MATHAAAAKSEGLDDKGTDRAVGRHPPKVGAVCPRILFARLRSPYVPYTRTKFFQTEHVRQARTWPIRKTNKQTSAATLSPSGYAREPCGGLTWRTAR